MKKTHVYNVPYRRRRKGITNYKLRRKLASSKLPRIVIRISGKHITSQIIETSIGGDKVLSSVHSNELRNFKYIGALNNVPAAYLVGFLCGLKTTSKGIKEAILDLGLKTPSRGAKVFAVVKGLLDAGIQVSHDPKILPKDGRLKGEHIAKYASRFQSDPEIYSKKFSRYLARGLPPEKIPEHFLFVRNEIKSSY